MALGQIRITVGQGVSHCSRGKQCAVFGLKGCWMCYPCKFISSTKQEYRK